MLTISGDQLAKLFQKVEEMQKEKGMPPLLSQFTAVTATADGVDTIYEAFQENMSDILSETWQIGYPFGWEETALTEYYASIGMDWEKVCAGEGTEDFDFETLVGFFNASDYNNYAYQFLLDYAKNYIAEMEQLDDDA